MRTFKQYLKEDHTESDPGGEIEVGQKIEFKKDHKYAKIVKVDDDKIEVEYSDTKKKKKYDREDFEKKIDKEILFVADDEEEFDAEEFDEDEVEEEDDEEDDGEDDEEEEEK